MNPSEIFAGTYFIIGQINGTSEIHKALLDYKQKQEVLRSFDLATFNLLEHYNNYVIINEYPVEGFIKLQYSCLAMCDVIVTLPGWEDCPNAKKIVSIARIMGKEILAYSTIILKYTKSGSNGN